ncbi:uncharacterized protein LOC129775219 isoform X2 [Toxorhynchites rutilus septentrionalis]|uniref:uncharacterized protein LOC129775219 isoform X2 n=1 Tax=Toxorhynchites rutilus septentrionalis TaxID=329112 RepID=UPI00247A6B4D|nr:uncharacterized protein LOC129775219 isoform X2 [Toxorhynchites rutilus septentrionalis]
MSDLSTNICFDALSVLNSNVQLVENVCSICGASHYTQNCPEFAKGDHIKDKPSLNLSRSSVPNGLLIMDAADGSSCVVTSQKFAKGTRFGPMLAQKSYTPIKNIPFPLVLFSTPFYYGNEFDFDLQTLLNGRNVYLDTRIESKCNWMIHVSLARFSNEQNLICYQENDEIYYTAIKDIELGDILRVWYSRSYAAKIGATLLEPSSYDLCNNILRSVSLDYGFDLDQNQNYVENFPSTSTASSSSTTVPQDVLMTSGSDVNNNSSSLSTAMMSSGEMVSSYDKISLPPIDSLMKNTSPKYTNHYHMFDLDLITSSVASQSCDDFSHFNPPAQMHHSSQHQSSPQTQFQHHASTIQSHPLVDPGSYSSYQTLPEDTLSPADLINISLGASDMNISFDSFGTSTMIGYDGGSSSGSNLGDSGISVGGGPGMEKLHSRYSSSTDSLATLNESLAMVSATPAPSISGANGTDPDADKKYPCEICLRKYMTKSNLDKHMRKHNLFLCVFCMKLFQLAEELKNHECTERKSKTAYLHCPKCLKVLSNSWSLQRHMKIHKDPNESVLSSTEESADKILSEPKEDPVLEEIESTPLEELKASLDPLDGPSDSLLLADETSDVLIEPESMSVQEMEVEPVFEHTQTIPAAIIPSITTIPITNTTSSQDMITDVQAANGKQLYKCIVCAKLFKNPNALEKHLRKVHTVYTVSNDYKSEKKVLTQINQKKTSPIKPAIAKALATKLSQKNKKIEAVAATAINTSNSTVTVVSEQPVHVPRQYNKKKHLNRLTASTTAPSIPMQMAPLSTMPSTAPTLVSGSPGPTATSPNKSHSIIIISNLELTNNNLIDTSQLFLNQNSNALGNKIDVKVLNSTDKLPKLVPISNHGSHHHHHQHHQSTALLPPPPPPPSAPQAIPTSQFQAVSIPCLHPTTTLASGAGGGGGGTAVGNSILLEGLTSPHSGSMIENGGFVDENSHMITTESSPIAAGGEPQLLTLSSIKSNENQQQQPLAPTVDQTSESMNVGFLSPEELSNYQLKRHMEIHDSTYYMCPYCDRSPLKAKTSVRKHLNTVHPERAPPKEEMNKFISTLVVKDEQILRELYAKNERKIRNKCAKLQAKQLQQQQQIQQQHHQQTLEHSLNQQESSLNAQELLNHATTYHSDQHHSQQSGYESIGSVEPGSTNGGGSEILSDDEVAVKRKSNEAVDAMQRSSSSSSSSGISHSDDPRKKIKLVDASGQEMRYITATTAAAPAGNGVLKYLRKKTIGIGEAGSSGGATNNNGTHGSTMDNQMILDNLFDNISIENYEFDDNTSIQSYNLLDERLTTSFDQIQEKLDADLSFDGEQLKWQNNLMTNDSSNEIGDKLLNVEENIMLI